MSHILDQLCCSAHWTLLPMLTVDTNNLLLQGSHLGQQLTDSLVRVREIQKQQRCEPEGERNEERPHSQSSSSSPEPTLFLGMDSPQLPIEELAAALQDTQSAHLCPSLDGGYGMLSVPYHAPSNQVFAGVRWSHPLTALSQIKALTDTGAHVKLGRLMYDIDEPQDVHALCQRLELPAQSEESLSVDDDIAYDDCLLLSSSHECALQTSDCPYTRQLLQDFKLLRCIVK